MSDNALAVWMFGFAVLLVCLFVGTPDIHDAIISNISGKNLTYVLQMQEGE